MPSSGTRSVATSLILAEHAYADRFERDHVVVPNTVRVPAAAAAPGASRAVYLGSLTMARGAATLLQTGRLLTVATRGEVKVEIIGGARDTRTADTVDWGVKCGHVVHHGFVPSSRALPMLDGALAGLSLLEDRPNYRHSMPTKVIEYMAHGLPVITTPLPLAADLVERSGCGIVVPFDDAEATAAALIEPGPRPRATCGPGTGRTRVRPRAPRLERHRPRLRAPRHRPGPAPPRRGRAP